MSDGMIAAMGPICWPDRRGEYTSLDLAGLADIGWQVPRDFLRFDSPTYSVREDAGRATIRVDRFGDTSKPVTVRYATADATATAGSDYAGVSGILTFAPGETTKMFDVPILTDPLIEGTEGLDLVLTDADGNRIYGNPGLAALQIIDVPPPPHTLSISDATIVEGNWGTCNATFTISLSGPDANLVAVPAPRPTARPGPAPTTSPCRRRPWSSSPAR